MQNIEMIKYHSNKKQTLESTKILRIRKLESEKQVFSFAKILHFWFDDHKKHSSLTKIKLLSIFMCTLILVHGKERSQPLFTISLNITLYVRIICIMFISSDFSVSVITSRGV